MGAIFSEIIRLLPLLLLFAVGCERGNDSQPQQARPTSTNTVAEVKDSVKVVLTEEQIKLDQVRDFIDAGENGRAMNIARGLMESKDPEILTGLVDIFRWVGIKAMPELEKLAGSSMPPVSEAALAAWEMLVEEIGSDFVKIYVITNAAAKISRPAVIDSMLMHILHVESDKSLLALEGLVIGEKGKVASECAKSIFEQIAGEPYSSPERTVRITSKRSD